MLKAYATERIQIMFEVKEFIIIFSFDNVKLTIVITKRLSIFFNFITFWAVSIALMQSPRFNPLDPHSYSQRVHYYQIVAMRKYKKNYENILCIFDGHDERSIVFFFISVCCFGKI